VTFLPIFIIIFISVYAYFFNQPLLFDLAVFWRFYVLYLIIPSHFLERYLNYKKGIRGEKDVTKTLRELDDSYYLLDDVVLYPKAGNIDHIVLSPNGIFVIETKNYKGKISCYGDEWKRDYDRVSYPISSISKQAKRNAVTLKKFIEENDRSGLFRSMWVNALVVFTNPEMELKSYKPTVPILHLSDVPNFIKMSKSSNLLSDKDLKTIGDTILRYSA